MGVVKQESKGSPSTTLFVALLSLISYQQAIVGEQRKGGHGLRC